MRETAIRAATTADAPSVAEIWHDGWRDAHIGHVPEELVAARIARTFRARAAQRVPDTTVATVAGDVVGFIMVVGDEVEQVYVSRDHRGTGLAGELLTAAEGIVAGHGHRTAWLAVVAGNARARRFYERHGWSDRGQIDYPAATGTGSVATPAHRYEKAVAPPRRTQPR